MTSGVPGKLAALGTIAITSPHQGNFMVEGDHFVLQWSALGHIEEKWVNLDLFQGLSHMVPIARNVCVNGYQRKCAQGISRE